MKTLTLLLCFMIVCTAYPQTDSSYTFALPKLRIKQKENGNLITYQFENSLNKITLTPGRIIPDTNKYKYKAELNDIKYVYIQNGSAFWDAAGVKEAVGFGLGFILWGFFDFTEHPKFHIDQAILGGLITALPFGLIGGVIGGLSEHYDEIDLENMNRQQKYEALKRIFKNYQQKR